MSTSESLKAKPRRPHKRMGRLDSFSNPQPRPAPRIPRPVAVDCPNPACDSTGSLEEDGKTICETCGAVIQEVNMVSDASFGITSGGQHVLQGVHVGANEAGHRSGDMPDANRSRSSKDVTKQHGRRYIQQIGQALNMSQVLQSSGENFFGLAATYGFVQGRRIKSVAAVSMYIACRMQKDVNTFMLIDFADILDINVFTLGHIYKDLLAEMMLKNDPRHVQPINPEDLILRFCHRLEFGSETMKVAKDAVRLVQRMNRDWMTPGRRPAGVCGAALILAARMNNFRRTVREMVYVVKVQEQTILNRLDEFKATESSGLTVEEFRTIDLESAADPPIYRQQQEAKDSKKKRKRRRMDIELDDDGDNDQPTVISSRASSAVPANTVGGLNIPTPTQPQQTRIESQSMPPPPLPIDPDIVDDDPENTQGRALSPSSTVTEGDTRSQSGTVLSRPSTDRTSLTLDTPEPPAKRRRGRPPKKHVTPPRTQPTEDPALGADITAALTDPANIDHANALQSALAIMPDGENQSTNTDDQPLIPRPPVPTSEEISDSEFADDPEVKGCLLTPDEIAIKTRIWTHENRDYLRVQAAKLLKEKLAEQNGTARSVVRRVRRRTRMGDMSAYLPEGAEEGTPVAESPEEAIMKMMNRRAYSKKIDYSYLHGIYGKGSPSDKGSRRSSSGAAGSTADVEDATSTAGNAVAGRNARPAEEAGEEEPDAEQREIESIAGDLEAEGINGSEDEDDVYGDPDDPYEGGGFESD